MNIFFSIGCRDAHSNTATLAFDATSLKGEHLNAIHFCSAEEILTASVARVPGGKAEDYANHVCNTIDDLAEAFTFFHGLSLAETKTKLTAHHFHVMFHSYLLLQSQACCLLEEQLHSLPRRMPSTGPFARLMSC